MLRSLEDALSVRPEDHHIDRHISTRMYQEPERIRLTLLLCRRCRCLNCQVILGVEHERGVCAIATSRVGSEAALDLNTVQLGDSEWDMGLLLE